MLIAGTIPAAVGYLEELVVLRLSGNSLTGMKYTLMYDTYAMSVSDHDSFSFMHMIY